MFLAATLFERRDIQFCVGLSSLQHDACFIPKGCCHKQQLVDKISIGQQAEVDQSSQLVVTSSNSRQFPQTTTKLVGALIVWSLNLLCFLTPNCTGVDGVACKVCMAWKKRFIITFAQTKLCFGPSSHSTTIHNCPIT